MLVFLGMKGLAEYYKDDRIYHDAPRGLIFLVICSRRHRSNGTPIHIRWRVRYVRIRSRWRRLWTDIALLGNSVVFIFYLLAAMKLRKVFNALAQRSGEQMFETAGMLLFFGAISTMILMGFLLIFLAWIIATIAFFSIKLPAATVQLHSSSSRFTCNAIHAFLP